MAIKVNKEAADNSKQAMDKALQSYLDSMKQLDKVVDDFGKTQEGNWVKVIQDKYRNEFQPTIKKGITENVVAFADMFIKTVDKWIEIDAGVK